VGTGAGPDGAGRAPAGPPLSEDGLPRRIRQASLAPQLRERSAVPPEPVSASPLDRSPEEIRAMMSALQAGTRRGRLDGGQRAPDNGRSGANGRFRDGGDGGPPRAVPLRLAGAAGTPAAGAALDVPFTGPLGADPLGADPLGADPLGTGPLGADPLGTDPLGIDPPVSQTDPEDA
jgi:hypothetical protein